MFFTKKNAFLLLLVLHFLGISAAADLSKFSVTPAFELPADAKPEPLPLRWAGGWVLARVKINDVDAGWFQIATGWKHSVIDPLVAARLKLQEIPEFGLVTQNKPADARFAAKKIFRADFLQCGQATSRDVPLEGFDLTDMSMETVKMHGEGISGVLGWDLLRTLPFLLDEPALQLTWQREARLGEDAVRIPVIEKYGCPFIETTLGGKVKTLAMINTAGFAVTVQRQFLKQHLKELWQGRINAGNAVFYGPPGDDDALPVNKVVDEWPKSRWLTVGFGGAQEMQTLFLSPRTELSLGEVQICYSLLRRHRLLFDGPGKALWSSPSATVPEQTLAGITEPPPSPYLLTRALQAAIDCDDVAAVRAVIKAGADLKGAPRQEPLQRACREGSQKAAAALIEAGALFEPVAEESDTPLVCASANGDTTLIKILLFKGADPNRASSSDFTPLEAAARSGSVAAVDALLEKTKFPEETEFVIQIMGEAAAGGNLALAKKMLPRIPVPIQSQIDWALVLEQALLLGHPEMAEWILTVGKPSLKTSSDKLPPLLSAILPTRMEKTDAIREKLVALLIAAGADANASRKGVTPLLLAARHGNAAIMRQLIAAGAKVTAKDYKQRNALQRAADANQPADVIAPLLKSGIDLEDIDSETELTALAQYAKHGNHEACRALLDAGAKPDGHSMFGPPPLGIATNGLHASDEDTLAVVKLLLQRGAKASAAEENTFGPLFGASINCRYSLIQPLVDGGANLEKRFVNVTALGWACSMPSAETVKALLEAGANPNSMDQFGITPLCHAAAAGRAENMKLLLERGVSPDAPGPLGVPPIWMAAAHGQTRAVRLLLAAGAKPDAIHPTRKTTALQAAHVRDDPALISLLTSAVDRK